MNKDKFLDIYDEFEIEKIDRLFNTYDLENNEKYADVIFLMPIICKIKFLKDEYKNIVLKDYNSGSLKTMADVSKQHKCIYDMLESGMNIDTIIALMIEDYKSSIHILYADDDIYYKTAYKDYCEHFGIDYPGENRIAKYSELFDELCDILL